MTDMTPESTETPSSKSSESVTKLARTFAHDTLREILWKEDVRNDLLRQLRNSTPPFDPTETQSALCTALRGAQHSDDPMTRAQWNDITTEDLMKHLSADAIRESVLSYTTIRVRDVEDFLDSMDRRYTLDMTQTAALRKKVDTFSDSELIRYARSKSLCHRDIISTLTSATPVLEKDEGQIMTDSGLTAAGLQSDPQIMSLVKKYKEYSIIHDYNLRSLLSKINSPTVTDTVKFQILAYFVPSISVGFLLKYGIIDQTFLDPIIDAQIRTAYDATTLLPTDPSYKELAKQILQLMTNETRGYQISTQQLREAQTKKLIDVCFSPTGADLLYPEFRETILGQKTEKNISAPGLGDPALDGIHAPDILTFDEMRIRIRDRIVDDRGACRIAGIDDLREGSTFIQTYRIGEKTYKRYYRVEKTDTQIETSYPNHPDRIVTRQGVTLRKYTPYAPGWENVAVTYDQILEELHSDYRTLVDTTYEVTNETPTDREELQTFESMNQSHFGQELDRLDPAGIGVHFVAGTHFWYPTPSGARIAVVGSISDAGVTILDSLGREMEVEGEDGKMRKVGAIPFERFIDRIQDSKGSDPKTGFRRIRETPTTALGLLDNLTLHEGLVATGDTLKKKNTTEVTGDGNDKIKNLGDQPIKIFQNKFGKWFQVEWAADGKISIAHYRGFGKLNKDGGLDTYKPKNETTRGGENKASKVLKGNKHHFSVEKHVTYARLLELIEGQGYQQFATEDPVSIKEKEAERNAHHAHGHTGWFDIMTGASGGMGISNIVGSIKSGWKMFEHALHDNEDLAAAKKLYYMCLRLYGPDSHLTQHAQSQVVSKISKAIEGKKEPISGLTGQDKRIKALNIAHNTKASIEETFAALLVVAEEGDLYHDSKLGDEQGKDRMWFRAIVGRLGGFDVEAELRLSETEVGDGQLESGTMHPSEHQMITRFFKRNQHNIYVKAIGGGSKFWKTIAEGRDKNIKKGQDEAGELSNGGDRAIYAKKKAKSGELDIVVGALEKVFEKDPSAANLGVPFALAMGNFSNIADSTIANKIKGLFYKIPFHALAFARNGGDTAIYQQSVHMAMKILIDKKVLKDSDMKKFLALEKMRGNGRTHSEDMVDGWIKFWDTYGKLLHPILQGTDPTFRLIQSGAKNNNEVEYTTGEKSLVNTYMTKLDGWMNEVPPANEEMMSYGGYSVDGGSTASLAIQKTDGARPGQYRSISKQLAEMTRRINTHTGSLVSNSADISAEQIRDSLWEGQILQSFDDIRDLSTYCQDEVYQKEQFQIFYTELSEWISTTFSHLNKPSQDGGDALSAYLAINDSHILNFLRAYGFDLRGSVIFGQDRKVFMETAYQRFMRRQTVGGVRTHTQDGVNATMTQSGLGRGGA